MLANEDQKHTLLEEGIAAARNGNRSAARSLLLQLSEIDQSSEVMWLWLSSVAVNRNEARQFAQRAMDVNPGSHLAQDWLTRLAAIGSPDNSEMPNDPIEADPGSPPDGDPEYKSQTVTSEGSEGGMEFSQDATEALLGEIGKKAVVIQKALEDVQRLTEERADKAIFANAFQLGVGYLNVHNLTRLERDLSGTEGALPENPSLDAQVEELLKHINQITGFTNDGLSTYPVRTVSGTRGTYRILFVDDSATLRKLVSARLENAGHQVHCAAHGREALTRLKEFVPDLVLSDITMPHMDGYQLCKTIRNNPLTHNIPVIMLSGRDGEFDRFRGTMVGATDFITKPFEIEILLDLIEQHCQA